MKTLKYKFLRTGLKSENGEDRDWKIGKWRKESDIKICNSGFHCSDTPLQAFGYVRGEILAQVECKGESIIENDKSCWSEMKIVKAWHWTKEDSVALAIFAAEQVIDIYEKQYPNDDRPRKAIESAKAYLKDPSEKNKEASAVAWAAAWAATEAAAASSSASSAARAASSAAMIKKIDKWFTERVKTLKQYE